MGSRGLLLSSAISSTASPACLLRNPNTRHARKLPKKHQSHVSCKATTNGGHSDLVIVDRRGMLLGLTGTAAATTAGGVVLPGVARADDAAAADASTEKPCSGQPIQLSEELYRCDPEKTCSIPLGGAVDFELPSPDEPCRVRRPAHKADKEYIAKYAEAIRRQKELPDDDPRSFKSQAAVHDAFCNGFYQYTSMDENGNVIDEKARFNVHASWLFAPWHRMYIYFYERILGKLIDDDTFAMPFWNWDHPDGMSIPPMYKNERSPLYNANREASHLEAFVDLSYSKSNDRTIPLDADQTSRKAVIGRNLVSMNRQMITEEVDSPESFHGERYCAGMKPSPGAGRLERGSHTAMHLWVGDKLKRYDMGDLGTAGLDPLFYVHHANVDRMWHLWRHAFGNVDFTDSEWLDASFPFYDEDAHLVRIRVRDVLDASALRYTYQPVDIPWLRANPKRSGRPLEKPSSVAAPARPPPPRFPVALQDEPVRVEVARPRPPRTPRKKMRPEVLVIDGIELDHCRYAKFDVYVNVPLGEEGDLGPESSEFLGSFVNLPHSHEGRQDVKTAVRMQLNRVLREVDAADDDSVFVTLVSRCPEPITIGGARIEFLRRRPKGVPRGPQPPAQWRF